MKFISEYLSESKNKDFSLIKHLPYVFNVAHHGSGQRLADSLSCLTLLVENYKEELKEGKIIRKANLPTPFGYNITTEFRENVHRSYLIVNLRSRLLMKDPKNVGFDIECYLPIEYIKSLELLKVSDDKFTPILKRDSSGKIELEEPISSNTYYLQFRGLDVLSSKHNLYLPSLETIGLKEENEEKNSFSGFAVVSLYQNPVLYEFDNFKLKKSNLELELEKAIKIHEKRSNPDIKTYRGNEIIERLSKIKPIRDI